MLDYDTESAALVLDREHTVKHLHSLMSNTYGFCVTSWGMILLQGRVAEATSLARRHSHAPHFSRSLEWLLFTSLEFNADDAPSPAKPLPPGALEPHQHSPERPRRGATAGSLLLAAAALIRNFPQVCLPVFSLPYRMRPENLQLQQCCLRRGMQYCH